jgi:hypothetical protein
VSACFRTLREIASAEAANADGTRKSHASDFGAPSDRECHAARAFMDFPVLEPQDHQLIGIFIQQLNYVDFNLLAKRGACGDAHLKDRRSKVGNSASFVQKWAVVPFDDQRQQPLGLVLLTQAKPLLNLVQFLL